MFLLNSLTFNLLDCVAARGLDGFVFSGSVTTTFSVADTIYRGHHEIDLAAFPLQNGIDYVLQVRTVNNYGFSSEWASKVD